MEYIKVKKKPVEVEAFEVTKELVNKLCEEKMSFTSDELLKREIIGFRDCLHIVTLEGTMTARIGDWIIKGVKGEHYPCRKDIFEETYDRLQLSKKDLEIGFALSKIPKEAWKKKQP